MCASQRAHRRPQCLFELNNFNGLMEICAGRVCPRIARCGGVTRAVRAGLSLAVVSRLKLTWEAGSCARANGGRFVCLFDDPSSLAPVISRTVPRKKRDQVSLFVLLLPAAAMACLTSTSARQLQVLSDIMSPLSGYASYRRALEAVAAQPVRACGVALRR